MINREIVYRNITLLLKVKFLRLVDFVSLRLRVVRNNKRKNRQIPIIIMLKDRKSEVLQIYISCCPYSVECF